MTLTITLTPEIERRLRAKAEREGLDAQRYVERLIEDAFAGADGTLLPPRRDLTAAERMRAMDDWVRSLEHRGPVLSDEAISREGIYEERIQQILARHEHTPEMGGSSPADIPADS